MDVQKPSIAARSGGAKRAVADVIWVMSFVTSWGLLMAFWDTRWAFLLVPLFVCHLGGLSEFVHQTVHLNLFGRSRVWNRSLGRIAGALLAVDFDTYRSFHLKHHRYVNTPDDPERPLYADPAYLKIAEGWQSLPPGRRLKRIFPLAAYVAGALASFGGDRPFVRVVRWTVPLAIAASGFLQGLSAPAIAAKVLVAWILPLLMLLFVDIAFAQSEHYATEDAVRGAHGAVAPDAQYAVSWNLKVPAIAEFFLLKRNMHAEHHLVPGIHWTDARDLGAGRLMRFTDYLRMLWRRGPRT